MPLRREPLFGGLGLARRIGDVDVPSESNDVVPSPAVEHLVEADVREAAVCEHDDLHALWNDFVKTQEQQILGVGAAAFGQLLVRERAPD